MPGRFLSLVALLAVLGFAAAVAPRAQTPLAVTWSSPDRSLDAVPYEVDNAASDPGAKRGRFSAACRSTVTAAMDVPVVVRFDSTEATLMGRGINVVDAVGTFYGSAWDVSDPDAPRRLNMLFRESTGGTPDTSWTPGVATEPLLVMASSYDGTGTSYAGRNLALQTVDCAYSLHLEPADDPSPGAFEVDLRPALVFPVTAYRSGGATGTTTEVEWTYAEPVGDAIRVRRVAAGRDAGPVVATLPLSARAFTDTGYAPDTLYGYRVEVVDAGGRRLHTSALTDPTRIQGAVGLRLRSALDVGRGASDVWGYVGPDGREYALLNTGGLTVIDVTNPAAPVAVAQIGSGESDIEAYGRYAYITGNSGPVQVVDLADPGAPVVVATFAPHPDAPAQGAHTLSIDGDRLYLNGNVAGLSIWSLADPAAPTYLGAYRPAYIHDVLARGDTLYAALIGGGGVDVVDVSDPTAPTRITTFNYPQSGAHNICSTTDGRYLFVGDEVGIGRWTRVFDVSDLDNVELVAEIVVDPDATVHNCHVVGDRLYLAHYELGARVWDISDPTAPAEIAFYNDNGVSEAGIWTLWPHLPSGTLLASDISNGLLVLELDETVSAEPSPTTALATLRLAPNPTVGATDALATLEAPAAVALAVYDVLGRRVAHVADAALAAGTHRIAVPAAALPAGVYVVRLRVDGRPGATQTLTVAR